MFTHYISGGVEYFEYGEMKKGFPFPESLIRFLYLAMEPYDAELKRAGKALREYYPSRDEKYLDVVREVLDELAGLHEYFEFVRYDFCARMEKAKKLSADDASVIDLIHHDELPRIYSDVWNLQRAIKGLFASALDKDNAEMSVAEYFSNAEHDLLRSYHFREIATRYELIDGEMTEVLQPKSYLDLVDYDIRECLKRDIKMRVCKNCGRYFALTGKASAEYCDITTFENGRTCKDVGAMRVYTKNKNNNETFTEYRREYKRRFGWIRAGKIEPNDFYAWSAMAKEQEAACEKGEITFDEFKKWLARP
ncbi:MAG: hypothetical protein II881_10230 [Oscillospiraceae bacterium]|nr:hypothetical protein [Oscillospiraceae bacterium]